MKRTILFLLWHVFIVHALAQNGKGAILLSKSEYNALPKFNLPVKDFKALKFDTSFYLNTPPIGNQGTIGSCVGWGVGYTFLSTVFFGNTTSWDSTKEFSPSYIYNLNLFNVYADRMSQEPMTHLMNAFRRIGLISSINCNDGLNLFKTIRQVEQSGACLLADMPYNVDCHILPANNLRVSAEKYKITNTSILDILPKIVPLDPTNPELIKYCLVASKAPILIGYSITPAFDTMWNKDGIWYRNSLDTITGDHCVCIIGYSDKRKMFKVQNQWGTGNNHGDNGFFWVTYDLIRQGCFDEAYFLNRKYSEN